MEKNTILYFGYGMNTNLAEMAQRCPAAHSLGHAKLLDHVFRFAYHADVIKCSGSYVDGVLWSITPECLAALDQLEGFPTYYNRRDKRVFFQDRVYSAVTYFMQPGHLLDTPSDSYFATLLEGYAQHAVPADQLHNARNAVFLQ